MKKNHRFLNIFLLISNNLIGHRSVEVRYCSQKISERFFSPQNTIVNPLERDETTFVAHRIVKPYLKNIPYSQTDRFYHLPFFQFLSQKTSYVTKKRNL